MKKSRSRKLQRRISKLSHSMLIDFYIRDMHRRDCTSDSIISTKTALVRFVRSLMLVSENLRRSPLRVRRRMSHPCRKGIENRPIAPPTLLSHPSCHRLQLARKSKSLEGSEHGWTKKGTPTRSQNP